MVMLVLVMLITGARRIRHVDYLRGDGLVARVCGLKRVATRHTVGRWVRSFDASGVSALLGVNERLVGEVITRSDLRRLTVDVDGSVLSTGLKVEGARRGYNPHQRKAPSYYPVTAYEANTGQVLRVQNRAGNVHDGKASVEFLEALYAQLDETLERRPVLEMRMDGAFFLEEIIDLLESRGTPSMRSRCRFSRGWGLRTGLPAGAVGGGWMSKSSFSSSGYRYRHGPARCGW